jgi:TfoX/Sxy family transcriptional regulator of competence genes
MAYDEQIADRVRRALGSRAGVTEKKMFGGVAFLLDGKMFCGVVGDDLMVRVGPDRYEAALAEEDVRPMDFTGRPMNGYVFVGRRGAGTDRAVRKWVDLGTAFAATLKRDTAARTAKPRPLAESATRACRAGEKPRQ